MPNLLSLVHTYGVTAICKAVIAGKISKSISVVVGRIYHGMIISSMPAQQFCLRFKHVGMLSICTNCFKLIRLRSANLAIAQPLFFFVINGILQFRIIVLQNVEDIIITTPGGENSVHFILIKSM